VSKKNIKTIKFKSSTKHGSSSSVRARPMKFLLIIHLNNHDL
jgi:hypothetical protein